MSTSSPDNFRGKFAVLGIGPSGLTSAHALRNFGFKVDLYSKTNAKSELHGCQYLHAPIPGFEDSRNTLVRYELWGSPDDYRSKVYGQDWAGEVSPDDLIGEHEAWDIRETYDRLWEIYPGKDCDLLPFDVNPAVLDVTVDVWKRQYDAVFSTIPATNLCGKKGWHRFNNQPIWAAGDRDLGTLWPNTKDTVVCNGRAFPGWYRSSLVFGVNTTEWPGEMVKPPVEGVVLVRKPLDTNCKCYPFITRVGRFGQWKKGVLVHQVFDAVTAKALALADGTHPAQ